MGTLVVLTLEMKKLRHREIASLTQDHTAGKQQSQGLNLSSLALGFTLDCCLDGVSSISKTRVTLSDFDTTHPHPMPFLLPGGQHLVREHCSPTRGSGGAVPLPRLAAFPLPPLRSILLFQLVSVSHSEPSDDLPCLGTRLSQPWHH